MYINKIINPNNHQSIFPCRTKRQTSEKVVYKDIQNPISFKSKISYVSNIALDSMTKFPKLYLASMYKKGILSDKQLLGVIEKYADRIDKSDINYFAKNKIPITTGDTAEIIENRCKCLDVQICNENNKEYTENIDRILESEFKLLSKAPNEKKMVLLFGLPATGKSKMIDKEYNNGEYYIGDVDRIKKYFPSYETTGKYFHNLHNISQNILLQKILPQALDEGKNVLVQTTGFIKTVYEHAIPAKSKGYNIKVIYLKTSPEHSIKSLVKRYNDGGLYIDPVFVLLRSKNLENFENELKECKYIDDITIIDRG